MNLATHDGLEARVFWGETLLATTFRDHPKALTIGDSETCDFHLPGLALPLSAFPIVETVGGEMQLVFLPGMEGELQLSGEAPRELRALIGDLQAYPQGDIAGCYAVPLPALSFASVELAGLRIELQVKPMPRRVLVPFWETLDYPWLNTLVVFGFVMLVLVIAAATMPLDLDVRGDDLFRNPGVLTRYLPPVPIRNHERWHPKADQKPVETDGLSASADSHPRAKTPVARGRRPTPSPSPLSDRLSAKDARETVRQSNLMRLLDSGGDGLIAGSHGLSGELSRALGNLAGPTLGSSLGFGPWLRGTGGNGGPGDSIGMGGIGTLGALGPGGRGRYGLVGIPGHKEGSAPEIASPDPPGFGTAMDRELVRRVIHEHRAQLRFCYESELSSHPGMTGRISVKFTISADGSVQRAEVDSSTVNDRSVEGCITSRVAEWLFPKPKGGGIVVVNYPFILKASGE
jgi:hypothetical protein